MTCLRRHSTPSANTGIRSNDGASLCVWAEAVEIACAAGLLESIDKSGREPESGPATEET